MRGPITRAFLLGAGLGTRLQPLTSVLPKPLIPLFHRPLIYHSLDHCRAAGIRDFAINTHHLPKKWAAPFGALDQVGNFEGSYVDSQVTFFHEPNLLETGGGIKNIESWVSGEPILVYNGDILATIDLPRLIATHREGNQLATLALRSEGPALHMAIEGDRIVDIHKLLDTASGTHQFTGIYCIEPEILDRIPANEKVSIIPTFLELAKEGLLAASFHDEGLWLDLGTREAYLQAHRVPEIGPALHPTATIDPTASVVDSTIGPFAEVGPHCRLTNCVVWPHARIEPGAQLTNCVVYSSTSVTGSSRDADL